MDKREYQVNKIFQHLHREQIVEPGLALVFREPTYTYYSPYHLIINMGWEEIAADTTTKFPHINYLLHEVGHHLHHIHFTADFDLKAELKEMYYDDINAIEDYEARRNAYQLLPLEVEANEIAAELFKQVVDDWETIFGIPFSEDQIV